MAVASVLSEDADKSTELVLTAADGKLVGRIQSHFTFPVSYQLKSGKQSTAAVTISEPANITVTVDGTNLTATVSWSSDDEKDSADFQMNFTHDQETGDVTWTSAKLTVPVVNEAPFHFNDAAKDYDSELVFDYSINRVVSNTKEKATYRCGSTMLFEAVTPYTQNTTAQVQMSSTMMAVWLDAYAKDEKNMIGCVEDSKTTTSAPPAPTTPAPSMTGQWNVSTGGPNATSCLMLRAALTLKITYEMNDANETRNSTVSASTDGISEIVIESTCGGENATEQVIALKLYDNKAWDLQLVFTKDVAKQTYALSHVSMLYALDAANKQFPNAVKPNGKFSSNVTGLSAPLDNSYQCKKAATEIKVVPEFTLILADLQVQAFTEGDTFNTAQLCAADLATSDLVPIIVGACLAALVVVVLIAYLIGRARARRQGYSSV
jgi:lysosomal-associated membrane protein 1/2